MKQAILLLLTLTFGFLISSCSDGEGIALDTSQSEENEFKVVVIGKSVHPYWSNIEKGVDAAAQDLGLGADQVVFFVPPTEDLAKQIETMETYIAQGVTGIAIAPADPIALEPVI